MGLLVWNILFCCWVLLLVVCVDWCLCLGSMISVYSIISSEMVLCGRLRLLLVFMLVLLKMVDLVGCISVMLM